jgi:hypothetical protein
VESGNPDGLATLRKRVTVEQNLNALRLLHSQGISFDLGFMLFDPDSTFQSVSTNLGFLECISELGGPPLSFVKMLPLAGTAIEQRLQREGRLKGTELRPDYRLQDPRLELFSLFTTVVFSDRNSSPQGFVESFRRAHFLGVVCARSDNSAAVTEYNEELSGLIRKGNESALRLLRETLEFVERLPDARSVALAWPTLRRMADAEEQYWSELLEALDGLQCQGPSLGWPRLFGSVSPTALGTS